MVAEARLATVTYCPGGLAMEDNTWIVRSLSEERSPSFGHRVIVELYSVMYGDTSTIVIRNMNDAAVMREKFMAQEPLSLAFK